MDAVDRTAGTHGSVSVVVVLPGWRTTRLGVGDPM
jgi:hypothetical protein